MEVAMYLGHCGARPNRYVVHRGIREECEAYLDALPVAPGDKICPRCGGYTGTATVFDVCRIEEEDLEP